MGVSRFAEGALHDLGGIVAMREVMKYVFINRMRTLIE